MEGGAVGMVFSVEGWSCGQWFSVWRMELLAVVFRVVVEMDYPLLPGVE